MRFSSVLVAGLVLACAGGAATAQTSLEDQLRSDLQAFIEQNYPDYQPVEVDVASLEVDQSDDGEIDFLPGRDYVIAAVCDPDCEDIDMYLYTAEGDEVGVDVEDGPYPYIDELELETDLVGLHILEIYMVTCNASPCYLAVGVFERQ